MNELNKVRLVFAAVFVALAALIVIPGVLS